MRKIGSTRRAHSSPLPRFSASNCQLFIKNAKRRYTLKVKFEFWAKLAANSHLNSHLSSHSSTFSSFWCPIVQTISLSGDYWFGRMDGWLEELSRALTALGQLSTAQAQGSIWCSTVKHGCPIRPIIEFQSCQGDWLMRMTNTTIRWPFMISLLGKSEV